jgi:RNA polymerase sigma-70 factor (ECF subfamily)
MKGGGAMRRSPEQYEVFLELITKVEGELLGFVHHRVGGGRDAKNIVQETFLRAWQDTEFDPCHPHARAWLFKTASNLSADHLKSADSTSVSLDEMSENLWGEGSRGSMSSLLLDRNTRDPLVELIAQEDQRRLAAALARLRADYREVLVRYYLRKEGTQYQIAEAMGLSVANFNTRLNRARVALKNELLTPRTGRSSPGDL